MKRGNLLQYIGFIIIVALICGALIIFITPYLYSLHPFTKENPIDPDIELVEIVSNDTIQIKGDTLVCKQRTIDKKVANQSSHQPTIGDLGTFGDSAGFWNAIFSALAMMFVVLTLVYQSKKDAKDDERARLAQFQEQCLAMLSMLSEIVSQLRISQKTIGGFDIGTSQVPHGIWNPTSNQSPTEFQGQSTTTSTASDITGRACFKYIYDERPAGRSMRDYIVKYYENPNEAVGTEDLYMSLKKITETHFDHYFRTLYRILLFIRDSDLGDTDKMKQEKVRDLCADLVRAQLSTYELTILYYNGLFPKYRKTSKDIYEHFCLFDNLEPQFLILPSEKDYYNRVQTHHSNMENFDKTIHYDCRAFTKIIAQPHESKNSSIWRRIKLPKFIRRFNLRSHGSANISGDMTNEERMVYNVLKALSGQICTIKELIQRSQVVEKSLKKIVKKFEQDEIISVSHTPNGKRYTVLKDLY